jgi:hypothetical protein
MALTLRQLQFFDAAAEHESVSRAAVAYSIAQSSVTEAIKRWRPISESSSSSAAPTGSRSPMPATSFCAMDVSVRTIERWMDAGLPVISIGRTTRFDRFEVEAWMWARFGVDLRHELGATPRSPPPRSLRSSCAAGRSR